MEEEEQQQGERVVLEDLNCLGAGSYYCMDPFGGWSGFSLPISVRRCPTVWFFAGSECRSMNRLYLLLLLDE